MQRTWLTLTLSATLTLLSAGCVTTGPLAPTPPVTATDRVVVTQDEMGAVITAPEDVLFDLGRHEVRTDAHGFVASLVDSLNNKTGASILIEVHTDNAAGASAGMALSDRRADALRRSLVAGGVVLSRITTVGLGSSQPVASNQTAGGRALNRRVAIILIGETAKNLTGDGSLFRDIGNRFKSAAQDVGLAVQNTTISQGRFDKSLTSRYVGEVTQCPATSTRTVIIINGSNVSPNPVPAGRELQHVVEAQLCLPNAVKRNIEQAVSVLQSGNLVFTSPSFVHKGMYRSRHQFFSTVSIPPGAPRGVYEIESIVKLDGRTFRQSTPFEVR